MVGGRRGAVQLLRLLTGQVRQIGRNRAGQLRGQLLLHRLVVVSRVFRVRNKHSRC